MKLLNYLEPLLKGTIALDDYTSYNELTFLRLIKEEYNAPLDSSRDIYILLNWIKGKVDVLSEELIAIKKTKTDNFLTVPEKDIDDGRNKLTVQRRFLNEIYKHAKNWEMLYPGENKGLLSSEISKNEEELPEFKEIIAQLHTDIQGIEETKENPTNYKRSVLPIIHKTVDKIKALSETLGSKEKKTMGEKSFLLNYGTTDISGGKISVTDTELYRKLFSEVDSDFKARGISWTKTKFTNYINRRKPIGS